MRAENLDQQTVLFARPLGGLARHAAGGQLVQGEDGRGGGGRG